VAAANVEPCGSLNTGNDCLKSIMVIISFNQNISSKTIDIFGQILNNWRFNQNINHYGGTCSAGPGHTSGINCLSGKDCPTGQYCNNLKSKLVRDTKRIINLTAIKTKLEQYRQTYQYYPNLEAGTYLTNRTLSVWPSWQKALAIKLNWALPIDPINLLGECPTGYNATTCWNEQQRAFATTWPDLPAGSRTYQYEFINSTNYRVCANFETSYQNLTSLACTGGSENNGPVINCPDARGTTGQAFVSYANISDLEGDAIHNNISLQAVTPMSGWQPLSTELVNNRQQIKISSPLTGLSGRYQIKLTAQDSLNNTSTQTCTIIISDVCMTTSTINYLAGTNGTITGSTNQVVCRGDSGSTVTAVPDTGYTFVKWSNNSTANPRYETNVLNNISLTAQFAPNVYTINFNPQGGTVTPTTKMVTYNSAVGELPIPTKPGNTFSNWNTQTTGAGSNYTSNTIYNQLGSANLYAIWTTSNYSLNYSAGPGGSISGNSSQTVVHGGDGTTVTAIPAANYIFHKWSDDLTTPTRTDINITANKSVTANFIYNPFVCGQDIVTDFDNNIYNTVLIGNQCWMKENLKTTTYRNGTPINNTTNNTDWNNYLTGSYLWYNNDIANKEIYGALYNIRAVTSTHGLCPAGWHVPSKQEFETMINSIGGYNNELKATGTQYWIPPNNAANNQSGFSARGSGIKQCGYDTYFTSQKNSTYFWSSTYFHNINYGDISYPAYYAPFINHWANETIPLTTLLGCYGNPVRCIKD
jgi:uncharacterized protein (TIGR02145 family)/uncharacterized repeat protein (TIGR02543 family)